MQLVASSISIWHGGMVVMPLEQAPGIKPTQAAFLCVFKSVRSVGTKKASMDTHFKTKKKINKQV